jgi:hypothetical protein
MRFFALNDSTQNLGYGGPHVAGVTKQQRLPCSTSSMASQVIRESMPGTGPSEKEERRPDSQSWLALFQNSGRIVHHGEQRRP